jgi:hypothetical protein
MECKNCGYENAPLKKTCENCHKVLVGNCQNNVTGEYGYRTEDGEFITQIFYCQGCGEKWDTKLKAIQCCIY